MKRLVLLFIIFSVLSSCCEKDVYIEPDIVDDVIGIYKGELTDENYVKIYNYKVKVIKITSVRIKIVPYIGNEFRIINTEMELSNNKSKLVGKNIYGGGDVIFSLNNSRIALYFEDKTYGDKYNGYKIQ